MEIILSRSSVPSGKLARRYKENDSNIAFLTARI
jgi:hypothetical protein